MIAQISTLDATPRILCKYCSGQWLADKTTKTKTPNMKFSPVITWPNQKAYSTTSSYLCSNIRPDKLRYTKKGMPICISWRQSRQESLHKAHVRNWAPRYKHKIWIRIVEAEFLSEHILSNVKHGRKLFNLEMWTLLSDRESARISLLSLETHYKITIGNVKTLETHYRITITT